jgi:hypothetical protein
MFKFGVELYFAFKQQVYFKLFNSMCNIKLVLKIFSFSIGIHLLMPYLYSICVCVCMYL